MAVFCFCFFYSNVALAETTTTDPIVVDVDGAVYTYQSDCPDGQTNAMSINKSDNVIGFGACYDTFALSIAINNVLQAEGISVDKVHYGWKWMTCFNTSNTDGSNRDWCNENIENRVNLETGEILDSEWAGQFDVLSVTVEITNSAGDVIETRVYTYDTWYDWMKSNEYSDNEFITENGHAWQVEEDYIQLYDHTNGQGTIYAPSSLGDARFRVATKDGGAWDGIMGPMVKDMSIWFTYRNNPCAQTALYDPSCDGYAEAYAVHEYDTNCSADATYDPGCPGYSDAYYNQQCNVDATYDSGCPGYASAYYDQQCSADPLYDSGCSGYASAYETQQCNANSQYSYTCDGYNFPKETDAAMNVSGQGSDYIFIYRPNNPEQFDTLLSDIGNITNWVWGCEKSNGDECPGTLFGKIKDYMFDGGDYLFLYTTDGNDDIVFPDSGRWYSFIEYDYWYGSCETDINYDDSCSQYTLIQEEAAAAEYNNQCSANPLYDSGCPGYASAYQTQQCNANPLYNSSCPGYNDAYFTYQCEANALYDSACTGYNAAYLTQQCNANTLYDSECPGYETAYFTAQCDASPLYDFQCTGNFEAQCDANTLYDFQCTGYEQAYLEQQCLYNPQYDETCNGYIEPVIESISAGPVVAEGAGTGDSVVDSVLALPPPQIIIQEIPMPVMIMPQPAAPAPEPIVIDVTPMEMEIEIVSLDVIEAEIEAEMEAPEPEPEVIEVETVNEPEPEQEPEVLDEPVEEETTEEETTEEETTEETTEEEANEEETKEESSSDVEESVDSDGTDDESDESTDEGVDDKTSKDTEGATTKKLVKKPLTAEQKQKAKEKKMKAIVKSRLAKLAVTMGQATSLADQRALQAQITALINYVPGFLAYGKYVVPGVDFYQPESIYLNKRVPENNRGLLNGLASQILHEKMVDEQYKDMD